MTGGPPVRRLIGPDSLPEELDADALAEAYAWPQSATGVRANMIATLDGAISGPDGRSGSIGDPTDRMVFRLLRASADAIVVGAGTARAENYGPPPTGGLLVVVSTSGRLPQRLLTHTEAVVLVVPECSASQVDAARAVLAPDRIWVLGAERVPPRAVRDRLIDRGHPRILLEGGPALLADWLAAGCVDELCLTWVPRLLGGGAGLLPHSVGDLRARPLLLLQSADTLLGRWHISQND